MNDAISQLPLSSMVPVDFAEKAMASVMQLHSELMDEKERRVELYRKLMEREQTVAELRMYVKLLEEKLHPKSEPLAADPRPEALRAAAVAIGVELPSAPSPHVRAPHASPPEPVRVGRPKVDNWKSW
ncbi:MAG: hypothetical protein IPJ65_32610 [Archangiaceae bacterium]|nr:hypothetical protein [Archangiaceae bacterium]